MNRTLAAAAILSLTMSPLPASAADEPAIDVQAPIAMTPTRVSVAASRPTVLPALYASYAALQAFDVYSTRQALGRGAREANPLMQGVVGNTGAMMAVKAGAVAGAIVAAEHLWKTNKTAAIAVMVASNGVAAMVASRNARTLRQLR